MSKLERALQNKHALAPQTRHRHKHGAYSDNAAYITSTQLAKLTICGRIPQAACADRSMKATTRIRTRDVSAAFHFQPGTYENYTMRIWFERV